jgi:hypothetical protein
MAEEYRHEQIFFGHLQGHLPTLMMASRNGFFSSNFPSRQRQQIANGIL